MNKLFLVGVLIAFGLLALACTSVGKIDWDVKTEKQIMYQVD